MSSFSRTVSKFAKEFGIDSLDVVQKTAIDIHSQFIDGTPRDTGRAASSWNLTKDEVSLEVAPEGGRGSPIIKADITSDDLKKNSVTFFISNNLKYIVPLSRGHSKRAPNGWIERIVNRYVTFLKAQVK